MIQRCAVPLAFRGGWNTVKASHSVMGACPDPSVPLHRILSGGKAYDGRKCSCVSFLDNIAPREYKTVTYATLWYTTMWYITRSTARRASGPAAEAVADWEKSGSRRSRPRTCGVS